MINITDPQCFMQKIHENAINRFGVLTKNDYEVLLYHLLNNFSNLKGKSLFEQSIELRIPEAKLKRLAYEAKLKHGDYNRSIILEAFLRELQKSKYTADGKNIRFAIQDKYLRAAIQAEVYKMGSFMDGSFNSDIVSINGEALVNLLKELFDDKRLLKDIEQECEKAIRKESEKVFSWKDLGLSLLSGAAETLPSFLSSILTPGVSAVNIANQIILAINK